MRFFIRIVCTYTIHTISEKHRLQKTAYLCTFFKKIRHGENQILARGRNGEEMGKNM